MFDKNVLKGMKLPELKEIAKKVGVEKLNLKKEELIEAVLKIQEEFQKSEPKAETPVKEASAVTNESAEKKEKESAFTMHRKNKQNSLLYLKIRNLLQKKKLKLQLLKILLPKSNANLRIKIKTNAIKQTISHRFNQNQ